MVAFSGNPGIRCIPIAGTRLHGRGTTLKASAPALLAGVLVFATTLDLAALALETGAAVRGLLDCIPRNDRIPRLRHPENSPRSKRILGSLRTLLATTGGTIPS